jgi:hypothetical protein
VTAPAWQANTTYLVTARVTKVTPDGTAWWATSATGVSGNVEPTWPTVEPWIVVDNTVTWALASSEREQQVAGLYAVLQLFQAANPTLLLQISASRPKNISNMSKPFAYVGDRDETMDVGSHIRTRTFNGLGVVVGDVTPDNAESESRMDFLVDGLVDCFTKYYHAASSRALTNPSGVNGFQPPEEGLYCQLISIGDTQSTMGTDA